MSNNQANSNQTTITKPIIEIASKQENGQTPTRLTKPAIKR